MKILAPIAFASILLISACTGTAQNKSGMQTPGAAAPSTASSAAHSYRCESGQTVAAAYPSTDTATVQYKGSRYAMQIAVSGSGARYVGGGLEWWTKGSGPGSEGTLFRHKADGTSGEIMERCKAS